MTNYRLFTNEEEMQKFKKEHGGLVKDLTKPENKQFYRTIVEVPNIEKWKYAIEWNEPRMQVVEPHGEAEEKNR